jgi:hypothetical protein
MKRNSIAAGSSFESREAIDTPKIEKIKRRS